MQVVSGDAVPSFRVQALDMWRNPCGTWAGMATTVTVECLSLDPPKLDFEVDETGEATISGDRTSSRMEARVKACRDMHVTLTQQQATATWICAGP